MKVLKLTVHNVMGVKDVDLNMDEHSLFVVGGANGSGKTSTVKSLLMAIMGKSGMPDYPDVPLKDGEDEGHIDVDLGGDEEYSLRVEFKRRRDGSIVEKLILRDGDGQPVKQARTLLQRLYGDRGLDPTAFNRLGAKEQLKTLQRLFPDLDFSKEEEARKELYEERTQVGREGQKLTGQLEGTVKHDDAPEEEVSVSDLMAELKRREAVNRNNETIRAELAGLVEGNSVWDKQIESAELDVKEFEKRLQQAKDRVAELKTQRESAEKDTKTKAAEVESLKDEDLDEIQKQISESEETNRKVRENQRRAELEKEVKAARTAYQNITDQINAIDAAKKKALAEAELPVEGLGIDAEGVTYNGLPYEQAPNSTRFIVGAKIAMALNPQLRLLVCEHGDGIDWNTFSDFDAMLKENKFQALIEVCSRSSADDERCQVVMVDGESKA